MTQLSPDEKREIVREELHQLVKARYISINIASKIVNAHTKYYQKLPRVNQINQELEKPKQSIVEAQVKVTPQTAKVTSSNEISPTKTVVKAQTKLTAKQVRDRNITWGLNLGIILLLLGGLVLATSTWDTLGNWAKTGLISLVSIFFFSLAWLAGRVLHIHKTAFAFLVLGSLFLPIVVVSAGYFELFGSYLSFFGEGKFLYGAIGTLIVIPIYIFFAFKLSSRLFVWFSYVSISVFVGLLIASLSLPVDGFYLGIMLYNTILILAYRVLKGNAMFKAFMNEFISFIQANLILSTSLMLIFYKQELFYSFNLLFTAVIYFAMIFVTNHKSYHFVFTAMIIYGAYQLVENSILVGVGEIAYALLGIFFLVIPRLVKDAPSLHRAFQITSAIISSLAFLYISFEGLLIRIGEGSIVLMIAYVIIALNFTYLAQTVKNQLFTYLSPIFFVTAVYQLALLGQEWFRYESTMLPFFALLFLFYLVGGCLVNYERWYLMKSSTRDVTVLVLFICLLFGLVSPNLFEFGAMLLIISVLGIVMDRFENRQTFKQVAPWLHASAMGFAVATLSHHFISNEELFYLISPIQAEEIVFGSLVVLAISYGWKAIKKEQFWISSFFVAELFYGFGIMSSFGFDTEPLTRAMIMLGGIGMAYLLYRKTNWMSIPYVISGMTLLFYLSVLVVIHEELQQVPVGFEWFEFILGSVILFGIGLVISKKEVFISRAFHWMGQLYMPFALLVTLFISAEDGIWAYMIATVVYGLTVKMVKSEWMIKSFFYAGCTTLWVLILLTFIKLELQDYISYSFLITSILLFFGWLSGSEVWKKRIMYYFLPFSSIGMLSFILHYPFDLGWFGITILNGILVLYIIHRMKWDILTIVPLLLLYAAVSNLNVLEFRIYFEQLYHAIFGLILMSVGLVLHQSLYQLKKGSLMLDWYTILALLVFLNLYQLSFSSLVSNILPGILIVTVLFLNRKRVPDIPTKWLTFSAFVYLLQPYYALLSHVELPELFEREFYVLPWIAVVIGLRLVMKENKAVTSYIQWSVLVIVALLLVQDGLASNTIYDALIVGVLSLASLVAGMMYQMKSFFFVGAGVLLFNVFMQTRPYWGNLPWWGYLLIAGAILFTVGSYNEWQKQKGSEGKETLMSKFKRNIIDRIRKWD